MDILLGIIGKIKNTYLPAYFKWLTEKLSNTEPFSVLLFSVIAIFVLVIYVWFRNRDGDI